MKTILISFVLLMTAFAHADVSTGSAATANGGDPNLQIASQGAGTTTPGSKLENGCLCNVSPVDRNADTTTARQNAAKSNGANGNGGVTN